MKFPEIATLKIGDTVRYSYFKDGIKYEGTVKKHISIHGEHGYLIKDTDGYGSTTIHDDTEVLHSFEIIKRA